MNSKLSYLMLAGVAGVIGLVGVCIYKLRSHKRIKNGIIDLMKSTPLIYIKSLSDITGCEVYAKCEYYLPYTSKDRMIKNIILEAEKSGRINKNKTTIYEGSSGSTAYSVAAIARLLGYKCKIVVPDDVSSEKMSLLQTTGCEIIITKQCPFSNFKDNYVRLAKKLALSDPNGFYVDQFFNTINYITHYEETGPEIYSDMNGDIDVFISGSGTGGTIAGLSRYLKERNRNMKVFLADVAGSGLHSYVTNSVMFTKEETEAMRKKYRYYSIIEGIGINFLTDNFKEAIIDNSFKITDDEAVFIANYVYINDGIFIGGSSAVNLCAVLKASKLVGKGKKIVTILYDSGLKYTSKLFTPDVLRDCKVTTVEQIINN
jgi:cysteine synthase A